MKTNAPNSENLEVRSEKGNQDSSFSPPNSHFSLHPPALVPKLRFPEFRAAEGWKPKRLGLALKFQPGFPFPSSGFNDAGKGPRLIRNRDLRSDDIVVHFSEPFDPTFVVNDGDVLVGMDGDFTPTVWNKGKALLNQRVGRILPREDNGLEFLLYALTVCLKHIEDATARTTVKHLSHSAVEDRHEPLPSPAEQQKLAECLSSVDEVIAAQARKVDALKTHKKGLMQQLFPREGETQPRLRFPEFQNAGEWGFGKLIDVLLAASNGLSLPQSVDNTGYKVTRIETISAGTIDLDKIGFVKATEDISSYLLKVGDILLSNINSIAHVGKSVYVDNDYGLYHGMNLLRLVANRQKCDPKFLFYLINTSDIRASFRERANKAVNQASINQTELGRTIVAVPSIPEQQRIASCLSSLDALITAETQQHEALKTHKRGLMQQLFPSPEEATP